VDAAKRKDHIEASGRAPLHSAPSEISPTTPILLKVSWHNVPGTKWLANSEQSTHRQKALITQRCDEKKRGKRRIATTISLLSPLKKGVRQRQSGEQERRDISHQPKNLKEEKKRGDIPKITSKPEEESNRKKWTGGCSGSVG